MFGSDRRERYDSRGYGSGYTPGGYKPTNSYGYGYSNMNSRGPGLFGGRGRRDVYDSYGYGSQPHGIFGNFGRRSGYGGRRAGLFSRTIGGGIGAIGSLINHVGAIKEQRREMAVAKGKRPFDNVELSLLWQPNTGRQQGLVKIPVSLDLFYLTGDDSEFNSRFVAKIKPAGIVKLKERETLAELVNEIDDFIAYGVNFTVKQKGSGFLTRIPREGCDSDDDWIKLQAICDSLASYMEELSEWFDHENIRHEVLEYARLASTMLAAVLEQAGFDSAYTVDCKQELDDEVYSWAVTDVVIHSPAGEALRVRVDLFHYVFEDKESEDTVSTESGVAYFFADGGLDLFDGRDRATGSGVFTGWDGAAEHVAEIAKHNLPVAQGIGKQGIKLPIISDMLTAYRNNRRVSARRERQLSATAEDKDTDVIFRNLLWYDTNSSTGKLVIRVVPFCILPTYPMVDGEMDKDVDPLSVGYNFLSEEQEYICSADDIELYYEEINSGASYSLNFDVVEVDGKYSLRSKKINKVTDDWLRLQMLTQLAADVITDISDTFGSWLGDPAGKHMSRFRSAVLASVLGLAGYNYARPVTAGDDWSVVDVALVRPGSKKALIPHGLGKTELLSTRREETFDGFYGSKTKFWAQACSDFVMVRVDPSTDPVYYSYSEDSTTLDRGKPIVSNEREGVAPFTGWKQDMEYQKNLAKTLKKAKDRKKMDRVLTVDSGVSLLYRGVSITKRMASSSASVGFDITKDTSSSIPSDEVATTHTGPQGPTPLSTDTDTDATAASKMNLEK